MKIKIKFDGHWSVPNGFYAGKEWIENNEIEDIRLVSESDDEIEPPLPFNESEGDSWDDWAREVTNKLNQLSRE